MASRFTFVGQPVIPKKDSSRFFRAWSNEKGVKMASINFGINANNSTVYVEMFGIASDEIRTKNTDREDIIVPWSKRNDPNIVEGVATFRKYFIRFDSLECDEEYITSYDMILKLKEILEAPYVGNICVTGTCERHPYKNKNGEIKLITRYNIQNVYEENSDRDCTLTLREEIFFNSDSIDESIFKDTKKVLVNGYFNQFFGKQNDAYIADVNRNYYVPEQYVVNFAGIDFENPQQKKLYDYIMSVLKSAKSNKKMYSLNWQCSIVAGAEEVPFDESQLTEQQKLQIELGLSTIESFKPRGSIYGPRVNEIRLVKPILNGEYANGVIELPVKLEEFEADILQLIEQESMSEVLEAAEEVPFDTTEKETDFDNMLSDLLG